MLFISNNSRIPLLCLHVCFITVRWNHLHIYSFVPLELLYGQIIWRCAVGYERKGIKLCLRLIYHDIMILFKRNWTPFGKQEVLKCVRQLRPHRVEFAWGCLLPGNRESNGKHFEQRGDGQFPGALSGTGILQSQRNPHSLNTEKLLLYTCTDTPVALTENRWPSASEMLVRRSDRLHKYMQNYSFTI